MKSFTARYISIQLNKQTFVRVSRALIWFLKSRWNICSINVLLNVGSICTLSWSINSGRGVVKFHLRTYKYHTSPQHYVHKTSTYTVYSLTDPKNHSTKSITCTFRFFSSRNLCSFPLEAFKGADVSSSSWPFFFVVAAAVAAGPCVITHTVNYWSPRTSSVSRTDKVSHRWMMLNADPA